MSSLLDLINQLITEHGSAEIQDKRITQVKEYATLLEKKFTLLEAETSNLKAENETLKAEKIDLQKDNAELKEKLKGYEQSTHDNLPKEQIDLLKLMAGSVTNEEKIVDAAKRNKEAVCFDLEERDMCYSCNTFDV